MKRVFAIGGILFLLCGCALIESLVQPSTYDRGKPFSIVVEAKNMMGDDTLVPAINVRLPEGWKLLGCTGSGLEDFEPSAAPIDIQNDPRVLEGPAAAYNPPEQEGYEWKDFQFDPVDMTEGQVFAIKCQILPTTCGKFELTYGVTTVPASVLGNGADEEPEVQEYLSDIFESRAISCNPEPVPTVNEWGMLVLAMLLVGSAIWFMRARKRQA